MDHDHRVAVLHEMVHQQPHQERPDRVGEVNHVGEVKVLQQAVKVRRQPFDCLGYGAGLAPRNHRQGGGVSDDRQALHQNLLLGVIAGSAKLEVFVEDAVRGVRRDRREVVCAAVHREELLADRIRDGEFPTLDLAGLRAHLVFHAGHDVGESGPGGTLGPAIHGQEPELGVPRIGDHDVVVVGVDPAGLRERLEQRVEHHEPVAPGGAILGDAVDEFAVRYVIAELRDGHRGGREQPDRLAGRGVDHVLRLPASHQAPPWQSAVVEKGTSDSSSSRWSTSHTAPSAWASSSRSSSPRPLTTFEISVARGTLPQW